ncbi:MAG: NAD-dependent epimerase/dehydratase family protein [Pseudomonas sp.]|uniref:NAD-dependent epimerase/dehydratase family protein n=1 Tax=Pseudomonas sp. TaxID=306 RepID=UPI00299E25D6|nr:NAD-dependent epimerase/dehydratase family protein [Pseudomonas sp.]MDX1722562.1 NAD-dependent epimerase/dehydratase family protein [Pseudomonas sp.]
MTDGGVGVLGARSLVGSSLLAVLADAQYQVTAFSRSVQEVATDAQVEWRHFSPPGGATAPAKPIRRWISLLPIWVLVDLLPQLSAMGAQRVIALSSTSLIAKDHSPDPRERQLAQRLADSEAAFETWAESHRVDWLILRPTLIYGHGRDGNVTEMARTIRRLGFFPVFGKALGLRQPVHADDVAMACLAALNKSLTAKTYALSGAEVLSYRDMLSRIFVALGKPPRIVHLPLPLFRFALLLLRCLPRYRDWTPGMAERMNRDQAFSHSAAAEDLDFHPRAFTLTREDLPQPGA